MKEQLDGIGIVGGMMHIALICAIVGTSILVFIFCWWRGILNFGQKAADEMVDYEEFDGEKKHESKTDDEKHG